MLGELSVTIVPENTTAQYGKRERLHHNLCLRRLPAVLSFAAEAKRTQPSACTVYCVLKHVEKVLDRQRNGEWRS